MLTLKDRIEDGLNLEKRDRLTLKLLDQRGLDKERNRKKDKEQTRICSLSF